MEPKLKRHDRVAVWQRERLKYIGVVHAVGAREVRLNDGTRWRISDGYRVGSTSYFDMPCITRATPDDEEKCRDIVRADDLRHRMKYDVQWDNVTLSELEGIAAILEEAAETGPAVGT